MAEQGESRTDWQAAGSLPQADAESRAEDDEGALPEGWEKTVALGVPGRKQAVSVRLDVEVLDWFRAQGPGYQTRINTVLRHFVRARQRT